MSGTIFTLTLRELAAQKRSLLLALLAAVPVFLAVIHALSDSTDPQDWTANSLMVVVVTVVLPLTCLLLGTSALGTEIEDGVVVYLLAKPIPRLHIVTAKFAAAALLVTALVVPATAVSGVIGVEDAPEEGLVAGFTAGVALGALAYCALFVALSIIMSRALIAGLAYIIVWEGLVTNLFSATSYLSIREYTMGIAGGISSIDADVFEAELSGAEALPLLAFVTLSALYVATRRLERIELTEAE